PLPTLGHSEHAVRAIAVQKEGLTKDRQRPMSYEKRQYRQNPILLRDGVEAVVRWVLAKSASAQPPYLVTLHVGLSASGHDAPTRHAACRDSRTGRVPARGA